MSQIASIVYKPQGMEVPAHQFLRVELDEARLVAGYGIEGDLKGGHSDRQLNIMSYETLTNLRAQGFRTEPGQMGEQIVLHRLDVNSLAPGTRLAVGSSAVIEVVKARTGCEHFSQIQGKPASLAAGQMGVMARVIAGGLIRAGDPVQVLKTEQHV